MPASSASRATCAADGQPAAARQVGLHDIDAAAADQPLKVPDRGELLAGGQRRGAARADGGVLVKLLRDE